MCYETAEVIILNDCQNGRQRHQSSFQIWSCPRCDEQRKWNLTRSCEPVNYVSRMGTSLDASPGSLSYPTSHQSIARQVFGLHQSQIYPRPRPAKVIWCQDSLRDYQERTTAKDLKDSLSCQICTAKYSCGWWRVDKLLTQMHCMGEELNLVGFLVVVVPEKRVKIREVRDR